MAALKSLLRVSNVPNLDQVPKITTLSSSIYSTGIRSCCIKASSSSSSSKLLVLGHGGSGMNMNSSSSSDERMKSIKENSILSITQSIMLSSMFKLREITYRLFFTTMKSSPEKKTAVRI